MTIYTHQAENIRKTWLLMAVFLALIVGLGWAFSYIYNNIFILYFAVIFSVLMNIGSYWYSDKLVIALSRAHPVTREEYPQLWNTVENLSTTAGLPVPKIYVIDDAVPNAFATGRNKEHAVVAVTSGLLAILNKNELEGVISHELSHVGNRDMLVSTVVVVLAGLVVIASDFFLRSLAFGGGRKRDDGQGGNPVFLVIAIVGAIVAPIFATLIKLAISRNREYLADASGVLLTRYPEGLASALEKISAYDDSYGGEMKHANNAMAHLYISNPFGPSQRKNWLARLFDTHPPIEDRIRILREGER